MNSIPNTCGSYILVFHLSRKTVITFDRKGSSTHSHQVGISMLEVRVIPVDFAAVWLGISVI